MRNSRPRTRRSATSLPPPMPLSWNEIKARALAFSREWKGEGVGARGGAELLERLLRGVRRGPQACGRVRAAGRGDARRQASQVGPHRLLPEGRAAGRAQERGAGPRPGVLAGDGLLRSAHRPRPAALHPRLGLRALRWYDLEADEAVEFRLDERTASDGSDLGPRLAHLFQVDAAGEPESARWIRPCSGAQAFLNGYRRWCLWLVDVDPALLRRLQHVLARIEQVKRVRRASKAATTRVRRDAHTVLPDRPVRHR